MRGATGHNLREDLALLAKKTKAGIFSINEAAKALNLPTKKISERLATLVGGGWIVRIRRGLYLIPSLEAEPWKPTMPEDGWVLAVAAFSPCYIGGWSAAEHWHLTEQIFRTILVFTAASVRASEVNLHGYSFRLFKVPKKRLEGISFVWRGTERIPISSPERTIADGLRNPEVCGGIRHLIEIVKEYAASSDDDWSKLMEAMRGSANGAAWKRFGFLVETLWPERKRNIAEAEKNLSAGYARLEPRSKEKGTLTRRWRLWVNIGDFDKNNDSQTRHS
ncbi:MAG: type IV toxin-antitoxin system AbiEi family antitoxin [Patescibacteria group bacterium]|jgi:predicted transcriptional regulator of viral defense system